jgi:hypothetical protein
MFVKALHQTLIISFDLQAKKSSAKHRRGVLKQLKIPPLTVDKKLPEK